MQNNPQAIEIALRVLSVLTARIPADESDVAELQKIVPDAANLPADELACEVIQRALQARTIARHG